MNATDVNTWKTYKDTLHETIETSDFDEVAYVSTLKTFTRFSLQVETHTYT